MYEALYGRTHKVCDTFKTNSTVDFNLFHDAVDSLENTLHPALFTKALELLE